MGEDLSSTMAHYSFMYIDFCDRETWEAFIASDDEAAIRYARRQTRRLKKEFLERFSDVNFKIILRRRWYRIRKVYNWTADVLIYPTDN